MVADRQSVVGFNANDYLIMAMLRTIDGTSGSTLSPCINICVMDAATGLCTGCHRTLDEIGGWSMMPEQARRTVMAELEGRRMRTASRGP